jgi:hypothetical protein
MSFLESPRRSVYYGKVVNVDNQGTTTSYSADGRFNWLPGGTNTLIGYHLVFDPDHSRVIAVSATGDTTSYSMDGGATWVAGGNLPFVNTGCTKPVHDPINHTVSLVAQEDAQGGIYTIDGGVTWVRSASVTALSRWYSSAYDPVNKRVVAISWSTAGSIYSPDGGLTWNAGGAVPNIMAGLCWDKKTGRLLCLPSAAATGSAHSSDGGTTWIAGGLVADSGVGRGYTGMAYDSIHDRVVGIGEGMTNAVFSSDGGVTWSLGGNIGSTTYYARHLLHNFKTGMLQFTDGNSDKIIFSGDGGQTWLVTTVSPTQGPVSAQWQN